jgi:hypothetical protein
MSAVVKLAAALPGEPEINGLDAERDDLLANPTMIRAAVVWYDARSETTNYRTGDKVPMIELRRFEPLGPLEDVPDVVRDLVIKRAESRTGRTPLPFDEIDPPHDAGDGPEDVD